MDEKENHGSAGVSPEGIPVLSVRGALEAILNYPNIQEYIGRLLCQGGKDALSRGAAQGAEPWVSVDVRLPRSAKDEYVQVYSKAGFQNTLQTSEFRNQLDYARQECMWTHWKPLGPSPEAAPAPAPQGEIAPPEPPVELWLDSRRLDWLDRHCAFVADPEYKIGPFAVGELRQMADAGLAADWVNKRIVEGDPPAPGAQAGLTDDARAAAWYRMLRDSDSLAHHVDWYEAEKGLSESFFECGTPEHQQRVNEAMDYLSRITPTGALPLESGEAKP